MPRNCLFVIGTAPAGNDHSAASWDLLDSEPVRYPETSGNLFRDSRDLYRHHFAQSPHFPMKPQQSLNIKKRQTAWWFAMCLPLSYSLTKPVVLTSYEYAACMPKPGKRLLQINDHCPICGTVPWKVQPPSARISTPLIYPAPLEQRNAISCPIS